MIAADTIVYIGGSILGKPQDGEEAKRDAASPERSRALGIVRLLCMSLEKGEE